MAIVNRLANFAQDNVYDFLTESVKPQSMTRVPNGDGWLTTTYTMVGRGSDNDIMVDCNTIDKLALLVELFWSDQHRTDSIWLEESATGEPAKRSLIQSIELTQIQDGWFTPAMGKNGAFYSLTIIHSATWEYTTVELSENTNISCTGGTIALPAIYGAYAGRISLLTLAGDSDNGGSLTTFWGGIRPIYNGSSDFNPVFELEKGTIVAPAVLASDSDNASPVGTTDNIVTYACTTDDVKIIYETMNNAYTSTNYQHWVGDYLVLLRAKLSAATAVRLHINSGYIGGTVFNIGPNVYTSSTDYTYLEMGTVSIPPFVRNVAAAPIEDFEFQVYAQQLGGANTLTVDCLVLIPATHGFKITGAIVEAADTSWVYSRIHEDGLASCINYSIAGAINIATQFAPNNWVYPKAGGVFVLAGQRSTIQNVNDVAEVNISSLRRYRTHGE
jgi:hypothetical protein